MEHVLTKTYFTGQKAMIEEYGERFWEDICDEFAPDEIFSRVDVAKMLERRYKFAPRTAASYAYALVGNLVAMPEGGLFTVGRTRLRFHDLNGF